MLLGLKSANVDHHNETKTVRIVSGTNLATANCLLITLQLAFYRIKMLMWLNSYRKKYGNVIYQDMLRLFACRGSRRERSLYRHLAILQTA